GAIGAYLGLKLFYLIPAGTLKWFTASMLILSSLGIAIRIFKGFGMFEESTTDLHYPKTMRFWVAVLGVGLVTGLLSGLFGIGSTPFIQIGLLTFFGLTVQEAAGTTMLVILPIALLVGLGYFSLGF